jgi:type 1 fimbria pilin
MNNNYLSYKSIFILILFNVLILLLLSLTSKATTNSFLPNGSDDDDKYNKGVTVSPSNLKFNVDLGKLATKEIKITNYTGKRQKFNIVYNDFDISNDGKSSFLEAGTSDYSLTKVMSISPTFVEIEPGAAAEISITVQLPFTEDANKAAWGVILISQAEEKKALDPGNESGNTVAFGITPTFAFGVWVYQNPPNVENMQVDITDFSFEKKADLENALFLSVKNQGDGISFCQAYVELTNLSTGKQTMLGGKNYTILPGYERIFVFDVPPEIAEGKYSAVGVLDYKSEKEIVAAELELTID